MAISDFINKFILTGEPEGEEETEQEEIAAAPVVKKKKEEKHSAPSMSESMASSKRAKVVSIGGSITQIMVVKLENCGEAKTVINNLRAKTPVVFNIARLDTAEARRAVDTIYGATFALEGDMKKASNDIFIVAPSGMDISGDVAEKIVGAEDFSWDV